MSPFSPPRMLSPLAALWAGLVAFCVAARAEEPAWQNEDGHRWQALTVPAGTRSGFSLLGSEVTGLTFTNAVPETRHLTNQLLLDGSGVAAGDADGDGRPDLFFAGLNGGSAFWRNLGGWRFTNDTATAFGTNSPLATLDATGCVWADLTGDGRPELVVSSHGQGTWVFRWDDAGRFQPWGQPLNAGRGGHTMAVADVDGDGWLDLYQVNYRAHALMDLPNARATFRVAQGRTEVATLDGRPASAPDLTNRFVVNARGGVDELGEPDVLFLNVGGTRLVEVPWTGGTFLDADGRPLKTSPLDWGLAAMFRDLNGDGRPDLYVANDFQSPDRLWWNESSPGKVRFRAAPRRALRHTSLFSMGLDFGDVNRDGHDDLVVLDMLSRDHQQRLTQLEGRLAEEADPTDPDAVPQYSANVLQLGRGDGTFAEVAAWAGVTASEWSWTPALLDVDLDGWEDLLVTTGQWRAARDLDVAAEIRRLRQSRRMSDADLFAARRKYPRLDMPNLAFRNDGRGRFIEQGAAWGFDTPGVKHGLCLADLDGDGDADVAVNVLNGPAAVYRNEATAPRVAVTLRGDGGNRAGIGARIRVSTAGRGLPVQSQELTAGGRYLSGDAPERTFATAGAETVTVRVRWPDGRESLLPAARPNRRYELIPGPAGAVPEAAIPPVAWLADESPRVAHTNVLEKWDEWLRQPLAPRRMLNESPGVTWTDLTGDGREDLVAGAGFHGFFTVFAAEAGGGFRRWTNLPARSAQTTLLPVAGRLLVGETSLADGTPVGAAVSAWPGGAQVWPAGPEAVGPLAAADVAGDGTLSVFVGGRVVSGRWPVPATSWLLRENGGKYEAVQTWPKLGLIQGAVFTDFDTNGRPDLVAVGEWGAPRMFRNEAGRLVAWDPEVRTEDGTGPLSGLTGWWTAVQAGDFDGDGRPDLVLGNWGENSFAALYGRPLTVVHGDLDRDGYYDVVWGYPRTASGAARRGVAALGELWPVHGLSVLGPLIPEFRERFSSHRQFAEANLATVLGDAEAGVRRGEAQEFASVVLLNRGEHWALRRLPEIVQWAPVWGVVVADWDGDGREDVFLGQNYSGHNHGWPRDDAGLGVLLRGHGDGGFTALTPGESGVRIDGESRGAATADWDADGRPDLAVAEVGGPLRLFRNLAARPGLRVRLQGPVGNPVAAGATVRWRAGGKEGPAREVRLGGGHWSVDAPTLVLARPTPGPGEVRVRWPGGAETTTPVAAGVEEVVIEASGKVAKARP